MSRGPSSLTSLKAKIVRLEGKIEMLEQLLEQANKFIDKLTSQSSYEPVMSVDNVAMRRAALLMDSEEEEEPEQVVPQGFLDRLNQIYGSGEVNLEDPDDS